MGMPPVPLLSDGALQKPKAYPEATREAYESALAQVMPILNVLYLHVPRLTLQRREDGISQFLKSLNLCSNET